MTAFWALAARDWPPSYPTHELVAAVGVERVAQLHDAGVLRHEAIRPYGTVTCRECRRDARVIYEAGGAVAICTGDFGCPDEELGPVPSRSAMQAGELASRLASALHLDGAPGREALVTPLGRRRIGDEEVAFDLCSHPGRPEALEALAACARRGPEVRVVLVPCSRRLRADAPADVGGAEIVWVGLDEVVRLGGGLAVDLRPVLARRRFRGAVAEPTFDGLVVEERGAAWCGQRVLGSDEGRALRLLRELAERPGEWVPRKALRRAVWPDDHTRGGELRRGADPGTFDEQLRGVVKDLRASLREVGLDAAVENNRGGEEKSAYRLLVRPERVRVA